MGLEGISQTQPVPSAITTPLVIVSAIFPVLSALAIFLRFYARQKSRQSYHADDAWVVVAWLSTFSISVLVWVFTSLSGIDYYRIDPVQGTQYSLEVDPISESWKGGRLRYDSSALGLAQIGTSIALDLIVLTFPLPMIYRLQMAPWRKVSISLILWLGAFCVIAAIIRLVFLDQSIQAVIKSQSNVFVQSKQFIFLILEPNCSIIAACLPCYGPLFNTGRGPESLLRSVRSMFSLRSNDTSKNSLTAARNARRLNSASETESQVELRTQEWSGKAQRDVHCVAGELDLQTDVGYNPQNSGIYVTNGVIVQRERA
ncbi:hypothetical protein CHU98_g3351 [Xylaria longipes]|nr:hypothetical protein CHU98_g3351 [Xylaria longipes]